jgi:hypothetical protein
MTSSGANTWSIPLEINNLESQIHSSGGSGASASQYLCLTINGTPYKIALLNP